MTAYQYVHGEEVNEKLLAGNDSDLNIGVTTKIVRMFYYEEYMC
jgi:hypothetical protein